MPSVIRVGRICGAAGIVLSPFVAGPRGLAPRFQCGRYRGRRGPAARVRRATAPVARFRALRSGAIIEYVPPIYVTGHRNPDADSIPSAIGYAELRQRLD